MTDPNENDIQTMQKYLALLAIQQTTLDLVTIVSAIAEYKLFTEEGTQRFEDIVNQFFKDVSVVLQTERDIQALRNAE